MRLTKIILTVAGALFFIDGACMGIFANFNFGTILTLLLGVLLMFWGAFFEKVREKTRQGFWRVLKYSVFVGLVATLCFCVFLAVFGNTDTADYTEDVVIILGCGVNGERPTLPLVARLEAGIDYLGKNPNAVLVVSGGKGPQESVTEAEAMAKYLIGRGVSAEKIILEDRASSTSENYRFSKELLDARFGAGYRVVTVTNDFHIFRAKNIAHRSGLETTTYHAPTKWYLYPSVYLREILAVIKLWVFKY